MKPLLFLTSLLLALGLPGTAHAATLNVPAQYATIQAGVDAAANGDTVLVAAGTYTGPGNVDVDFSGKSITVTSVSGPAATIIDCQANVNTLSSRGFIMESGEVNATINGFTVKNGYQVQNDSGVASGSGGGIFLGSNTPGSNLTVSNCIITSCYADSGENGGVGGGIYAECNSDGAASTITISNCTVTNNTAVFAGGGIDGSAAGNATLIIINCTITGNTASDPYGTDVGNGGGVYESTDSLSGSGSGSVIVIGCAFANNTAAHEGGGVGSVNNTYGTIQMTNCTLTGNSTGAGGGGGSYHYGGTQAVTNCSYTGNSGDGLYDSSALTLNNVILYGDTGGEIADGQPTANHCDVQGGYAGTGNIDADPLFVGPPNDLHLQAGSPCIGAGISTDDTIDKDGKTRPNPPSIGAYEGGSAGAATTVAVANVTGAAGQTVTLSATLTQTSGGALSGKTLTFQVDNASGSVATNASGTASATYTIPASDTPGGHTVTVTFAGDSGDASSTGTGTLTVTATSVATSVAVVNISGADGQSVTLSATLTAASGGVSGKTLAFQVNHTAVGSATTNSSGTASLSYTIPAAATPGSYPITASFAGDSADRASSGTGVLTVTQTVSQASTALAVANVTGAQGRTVTLSATLTKTGGGALSGKTLTFQVNHTAVGSATTNSSGTASLSYTIPAAATPGNYPITASFAGDSGDASSTGTGTLTATAAASVTTSVAVVNISGADGQSVTLSATLTAASGGVSGKTLAFQVNHTAVGSATTNSSGTANLSYTIPAAATPGNYPITASFAGDSGDAPSTGTGTLTATAATPPNRVRFFPRSTYPTRMVGGLFQGSHDNSTWTTLATVTQTPAINQYTVLPTSVDPAGFRYLRYLAPNGSYGDVAEIEFYSNGTKLTGTGFGTPGSYNNSGTTFDKALDGSTSTYFDAPAPGNGDYVGIDRGGPAPTITSFSPASDPVGTTVTVNGTNFTNLTAVKFGGVACTTFAANSATQLQAIVPAGAVTGTISVTTTSGTATSTGSYTVTVPAAALSSLSYNPNPAYSSGLAHGTVTLTGPAPAGGASITITNNGTLLNTVLIPAGQTNATYEQILGTVTTSTSYTLTANYNSGQVSATLTANPTSVTLSGFSLSPNPAASGGTITGTITLSAAAPPGGAAVGIYQGSTYLGYVAVLAGSTTMQFSVTAPAESTPTSVSYSESYNGATKSASVTVN